MRISVDTRQTNYGCRKCGANVATARHHKGCDKFIGRFNKKVARNYNRFFHCVRLCPTCHLEIHRIYMPYIRAWHRYTSKGMLILRQRLIEVCDSWLAKRALPPITVK